jgi:hypothetical protein
MTSSKLSPPSLHWSNVGPDGDKCDLCSAQIKPDGDCFLSIRRAFELVEGWMVETEPIRVLMCVDCGWTRPYAPMPKTSEPPKGPQEPNTAQDGPSSDVAPDYFDAGVMGDPRD